MDKKIIVSKVKFVMIMMLRCTISIDLSIGKIAA